MASALAAWAQPFYVATTGSDSNPGTITQPFLTLAHAQSAAETAGINQTIYIRGGSYYNITIELQGPVAGVGHDDTGLSLIGYPGDPPACLYGGQPLTNWNLSSNGMWQATLPSWPPPGMNMSVNTETAWDVRMLLVDGQMATRAQYPGVNQYLGYTNTAAWAIAFGQNNCSNINYNPGDVPSTMVATNAEVRINWSYGSSTFGVYSINTATRAIYMTRPFPNPYVIQFIPDITNYTIFNTVEGMLQPGQFYFDRLDGIVFYLPIGGKNPNTSTIIVPTTDRMFYVYGYGALIPVGVGPINVTYSNLTIQVETAPNTQYEGDWGYLWNPYSLIHLGDNVGGSGLSILNCKIGWCVGNAIGGDYCFITNCTIISNEVGQCGNYGICTRMAPGDLASNNFVHDCGWMNPQAPGLRINTNSIIIQNTFSNCASAGISDHDVDNCQFLLNHWTNCMQTNEDMGAYYQYFGAATTLPHPHGNIIRSNLFDSCGIGPNVFSPNGPPGTDARNFYRPAIYLDEYSSNTVVDHNITLNCPTPFFQNLSRLNVLSNHLSIVTASIVAGYDPTRIYQDPTSDGIGTQQSVLTGVVLQSSGTGLVIDNSSQYSANSGTNIAYSPAGSITGLPTIFGQFNPLFTSTTTPLAVSPASPVLASNIQVMTFIIETNYNGVGQPFVQGPVAVINAATVQDANVAKP